MNLTLRASEVKLMTKAFGKIVCGKTTLPVLQYALFRLDPKTGPSATVTSLDETLTMRLPASAVTDAAGPQAFLFPMTELKRLAGMLKKDDAVAIRIAEGNSIQEETLADGRPLTREIGYLPPEEFPAVTEMPEGQTADLAAFLAAYRTVLRSASPDMHRLVLASAFWDHTAKCMVATDGRRLCLVPAAGFPVDQDLIIPPAKLLGNGIMEGENGSVVTEQRKECVRLHLASGPMHYQLRCLDANYPNYRQVIPPDQSHWTGEFQIHDLDLPAVRAAVGQFTDAAANRETVAVFVDNGKIVVLNVADLPEGTQRPHLVLSRSTANVEKPCLFCLNARFFLDGLDTGCSRIRFIDPFTPLRFDNAAGALYVLMPWREVPAGVTQFVQEHFNAATSAAETKETTAVKTQTAEAEVPAGAASAPAASGAPATTAVAPETPAPGATAGTPATGTETGATARPALQFVQPIEPLDDLLTSITAAQDGVDQLQLTLRGLKQKARAVERYYRARSREIDAKTKAIERLKEAVSF